MTSTGRDDTMTIMGMPDYTPRDRDENTLSPLSTAGYLAGVRFPSQMGKSAPTGKPKTRADRPIKKTPVKGPTVRADNPNRPITGGRVLTPGRYTWDGVEYLVKIGRDSGKPYAVRADNGLYVAGMARMLRISDRTGDIDVRRDIPLGLYNVGDDIVIVRLGRSGHKFGSVLNRDTGRWVFTRGIMSRIDVDNHTTYAQVVAFGLETGQCMICERKLTNPKSIDRGIGPICAGKFGWGHIDDMYDSTPAVMVDDDTLEPITELADVDPATVPGLTDEPATKTNQVDAILNQLVGLNDDGTDYAPGPTPVTGPVMGAGGRLDHSGCPHPNTTAARTKCRSEFRRSN